jgi:hypothetical protein
VETRTGGSRAGLRFQGLKVPEVERQRPKANANGKSKNPTSAKRRQKWGT